MNASTFPSSSFVLSPKPSANNAADHIVQGSMNLTIEMLFLNYFPLAMGNMY